MKKIDVTKIEGYAEMSPEEKIAALEGFEYDDGTDTIQKLKDSVSNANSQAAEWKKKHNALLSEEEKAKLAREEELQTLRDELEKVKKDKQVSSFTASFASLDFDKELSVSSAEALAKGDAEVLFANLETFKKQYGEKIKAELMQSTPKPKTGEGKELTKDEFDKMSYSELNKLYMENPELYKTLSEAK